MVIFIKALTISSTLFFTSLLTPIYAQNNNQTIGSDNICGTQILGNGNYVICNVNNWPLNEEKKSTLVENCRRENFGVIPSILFNTKKTYNVGEIISIEYAGACPGKTVFFIVPESTNRECRLDTGMKRRSEIAQNYEGSLEFSKHKIKEGQDGKYVIHACFFDKGGNYLAGVSLPFEVLPRI